MTSLLKTALAKKLAPFFKGVSSDNFSLKFFKGKGTVRDLEFETDFLMDAMKFPAWMSIDKATCSFIRLKIPWTKLKTAPIRVRIENITIDVVVDPTRPPREQRPDSSREKDKEKDATGWAAGHKYGFIDAVLDSVRVDIATININVTSPEFRGSVKLAGITFCSTTPAWEDGPLKSTRVKNKATDRVSIFKELTLRSLQISFTPTTTRLDKLAETDPLVFAINSCRARLVLNKKASNALDLTSVQVQVLLDVLKLELSKYRIQTAMLMLELLKTVLDLGWGQAPTTAPAAVASGKSTTAAPDKTGGAPGDECTSIHATIGLLQFGLKDVPSVDGSDATPYLMTAQVERILTHTFVSQHFMDPLPARTSASYKQFCSQRDSWCDQLYDRRWKVARDSLLQTTTLISVGSLCLEADSAAQGGDSEGDASTTKAEGDAFRTRLDSAVFLSQQKVTILTPDWKAADTDTKQPLVQLAISKYALDPEMPLPPGVQSESDVPAPNLFLRVQPLKVGVYVNAVMQQVAFLKSCLLPDMAAEEPTADEPPGMRMHIDITSPSLVVPPLRIIGSDVGSQVLHVLPTVVSITNVPRCSKFASPASKLQDFYGSSFCVDRAAFPVSEAEDPEFMPPFSILQSKCGTSVEHRKLMVIHASEIKVDTVRSSVTKELIAPFDTTLWILNLEGNAEASSRLSSSYLLLRVPRIHMTMSNVQLGYLQALGVNSLQALKSLDDGSDSPPKVVFISVGDLALDLQLDREDGADATPLLGVRAESTSLVNHGVDRKSCLLIDLHGLRIENPLAAAVDPRASGGCAHISLRMTNSAPPPSLNLRLETAAGERAEQRRLRLKFADLGGSRRSLLEKGGLKRLIATLQAEARALQAAAPQSSKASAALTSANLSSLHELPAVFEDEAAASTVADEDAEDTESTFALSEFDDADYLEVDDGQAGARAQFRGFARWEDAHGSPLAADDSRDLEDEMKLPTEAMQAARVAVPTDEAGLRAFLCRHIELPDTPRPTIHARADGLRACIDTELTANIKEFIRRGAETDQDPLAKGPTVFVKVSDSFIQILDSEAMEHLLMFEPEAEIQARRSAAKDILVGSVDLHINEEGQISVGPDGSSPSAGGPTPAAMPGEDRLQADLRSSRAEVARLQEILTVNQDAMTQSKQALYKAETTTQQLLRAVNLMAEQQASAPAGAASRRASAVESEASVDDLRLLT